MSLNQRGRGVQYAKRSWFDLYIQTDRELTTGLETLSLAIALGRAVLRGLDRQSFPAESSPRSWDERRDAPGVFLELIAKRFAQ